VLLGADVDDMSLMEAPRLRCVRSEASGGAPAAVDLASKQQCGYLWSATHRDALIGRHQRRPAAV
jgi:hypothetical protein